MALLSVGSKMHNGRRDAVCLPSNLKSIRVCKDRERDVALIEIEGDGVLHEALRGFPIARQLYVQVGRSLA